MMKQEVRGRPFSKGNKAAQGNGRPSMTYEEKKIARLTRTRFNFIVRQYLHMNKEGLKKVVQRANTPALDLMVISVMNKAIVTGDEKKMNWFLEQLFGKLKETSEVRVTGNLETSRIDLSKLSDEQLKLIEEVAVESQKK